MMEQEHDKNDFYEDTDLTDGGMFDDEDKGDSLEGTLTSDPDTCGMCSERLVVPRVLSCLHIFCEQCLDRKLIDESGDAGTTDMTIMCPTCNQNTKVGSKKLASLPLDVMTVNISDVSNASSLHCTSCTAKEVAISRCCTCHNLLGANCDSAHRFMRCFEHHKVVTLDDMRKNGKKITVHKPLVCEAHSSESLLYYCTTCFMPACAECIKAEHKPTTGHKCEGILDSEMRVRQELENMLSEGKNKVAVLTKTSMELTSRLEELAHQRSTARDFIKESYHSYKAVLEQCRDAMLNELNELYHSRELKIMDKSERVGKNISLLEDACKFTQRLLENGTIAEIMYLRKTVGNQLLNLIGGTVKPVKNYTIEFSSDMEEFESAIKMAFGKFVTESSAESSFKSASPTTSVVASPPVVPPLTINAAVNGISTPLIMNGGAGGPQPLVNGNSGSLSTSMQSSFDGEFVATLQGLTITHSPTTPQVNAAAALQGFSSMAEYNLTQLATLAENTTSAATSPNASFSALTELFATDAAYKNLASLAKLGLGSAGNADNSSLLIHSHSHSPTSAISIMNGFGSVSNPTSPMISEDMIQSDPLNAAIAAHQAAAAAASSSSSSGSTAVASGVLQRSGTKVGPMQIRCKFGQLGPSKGQFNSPHGFCLGLEEDIIVADTNNHRIQVFEKTGTFKFQFGIPGKEEGQLWYPRKVAVMRSSGKYVVCDRGNERSRMQIFTKNGHFIKKIAIRYIDIVAGLAVNAQGEIIAVDSVSPTVFVISESGDLVRWFDCSDFMREPSDIAIHGNEFYICDFKGHNVVVFDEKGVFMRRIGYETRTNFPNGIDISDAGDVVIGDSHGNRFHVAVFSRDGILVSEFECPYVKVSRCCGLKITSEGYVVTLAKNNHHVLVLNTLYIL